MTKQTQIELRPNIVLILADDLGFSDIGCYGSEIKTPNLDKMAENGVRFSQMYNCGRCCPTRASLLTGLYPTQAGIGHMMDNSGIPEYQGFLRDDCVTIAEVLKLGGYGTYMSGKWHVGGGYQANRPETWRPGRYDHPTPLQRGFDRYYGILGGGGSYFNPPYLMNDSKTIKPEEDYFYLTDAITSHALQMIETAREKSDPFLLYVAYTAPHWPLHALEEDIARYEGKYRKGGWDLCRTRRHERLRDMGILSRKWEISPRDQQAPQWSNVKEKDWEDLRMAVYAAQIDRMDQGIGRILDKLVQLHIDENTMVLFLSDNGGCAEFLAEDTNRPEPWRYNLPTRDGRPIHVGNTPLIRPGSDDTFMSYDMPWANVSNTPFRLYKHWVNEGGISTPFVIYWPSVITKSSLHHEVCHVIDLLPTFAEAAKVGYPREYRGNSIQPMEGESFLPLLTGKTWCREKPLFFEHEGNRAVRYGGWKLVNKHPGAWELYNMNDDRTELFDLAEKEKSRVVEMARDYHIWAKRCGVHPKMAWKTE